MTMHYEVHQFHRQCLRMAELTRSRLLDSRELAYLEGSLDLVKAEIQALLESLTQRDQMMITDGTQRLPACCMEPVWDGPYQFSCGKGALTGVCSQHGRFR